MFDFFVEETLVFRRPGNFDHLSRHFGLFASLTGQELFSVL